MTKHDKNDLLKIKHKKYYTIICTWFKKKLIVTLNLFEFFYILQKASYSHKQMFCMKTIVKFCITFLRLSLLYCKFSEGIEPLLIPPNFCGWVKPTTREISLNLLKGLLQSELVLLNSNMIKEYYLLSSVICWLKFKLKI